LKFNSTVTEHLHSEKIVQTLKFDRKFRNLRVENNEFNFMHALIICVKNRGKRRDKRNLRTKTEQIRSEILLSKVVDSGVCQNHICFNFILLILQSPKWFWQFYIVNFDFCVIIAGHAQEA